VRKRDVSTEEVDHALENCPDCIRKLSGGTRSAKGSQTKTRLMSVFATCALQGKEPIAACAQMIIAAQTKTAVAMQ